MEIRILRSACSRCDEVMTRTINVLAEMDLPADVQKITDLKKIAEYRVMMIPGLVINGKVKSIGKIPLKQEIKKWIEEELGE